MSDALDLIIAGGSGAGARYDFSSLGDPVKSFFDASKQADERGVRRAFKDGVPLDANGQPDYGAIAKTLIQKGELGQGIAASNLDLQRQNLEFGRGQSNSIDNFERGGQPSSQPIVGPSANRNSVTIDPTKRADTGTAQPPPQSAKPPATVMTILAAQGIPNSELGKAADSLARQIGVDPTAPIDVNDPQVRNVLGPAIAQLKRSGIGQVQPPQPGDNPPQVAQATPPQSPPQVAQAQPAPVTNAVTTTQAPQVPSRTDQAIAFYSGIMSNPSSPKQNVDLAKERLSALQKSTELTPLQKEYVQAKLEGFKGTMQDYQSEVESGKASATERAKGDFKEQQDYIERGRSASKQLGTLNTITNIINSDKNLTLGYGGPMALKIKMALQQAGIDFGDLSGAETIQKLNGVLAAEAIKSISPRPTQFEFKTFLENNPGLSLDEKGNIRLLGILSQNAKREYDLGKLARQNQDNWKNWDDVVEAYDKKNPIKDPTTGRVLSSSSIIAPGEKSKTASGPQKFASPADVTAAVKSGKLKSGDSFLDPNGVTRYVP